MRSWMIQAETPKEKRLAEQILDVGSQRGFKAGLLLASHSASSYGVRPDRVPKVPELRGKVGLYSNSQIGRLGARMDRWEKVALGGGLAALAIWYFFFLDPLPPQSVLTPRPQAVA